MMRYGAMSFRRCHGSHVKGCSDRRRGLMKVVHVPVNEDNYAYILVDEVSGEVALVDPAEPLKVLKHVNEYNWKVTHCLTTHHHWDHSAGNEELKNAFPELLVYGGDERIPALTHKVVDEEEFGVGLNVRVQVLNSPCHTSGHVLYYVRDLNDSDCPHVLFTGDTLFVGGCGRFFEGNGEQMDHALNGVIAKLPSTTLIYCGHEYTINNLMFASEIEPSNVDVQNKLEWAKEQRSLALPTIPSTVSSELETNPFMRIHLDSVRQSLDTPREYYDAHKTMDALRKAKDQFRPTSPIL